LLGYLKSYAIPSPVSRLPSPVSRFPSPVFRPIGRSLGKTILYFPLEFDNLLNSNQDVDYAQSEHSPFEK